MIGRFATGRRAFARLLLSGAFLAALVIASPVHVHTWDGSEAACATCTFSHQIPSLEMGSPGIEQSPALESDAAPATEAEVAAGFESPSRPRSPPLPS